MLQLVALAAALLGPPPGVVRHSLRSLREVVFLPRATAERYKGNLLGVAATVELDRAASAATIHLSGVVLGGTVHGRAAFGSKGEVVLDDGLARALGRRLVRIVSVESNDDQTTISVKIYAPLVGVRTITLTRVAGDS